MLSHLRGNNEKDDLLVSGYIRENYGVNFIDDISKICTAFYDVIFHSFFDCIAIKEIGMSSTQKTHGKGTQLSSGMEFECYIENYALYIDQQNQ